MTLLVPDEDRCLAKRCKVNNEKLTEVLFLYTFRSALKSLYITFPLLKSLLFIVFDTTLEFFFIRLTYTEKNVLYSFLLVNYWVIGI